MESIQEKYARLRSSADNGDLFLVRGKSLLADSIKWGDAKDGVNAYWTHAGVIRKTSERLEALQSLGQGVVPSILSTEIFANVDFCFLKPLFPQSVKDDAVNAFFDEAERGIGYDYWMLPKVLAARKLGIKVQPDDKHKAICSVSAFWVYGSKLPLTCYASVKEQSAFITPQDGIRFLNPTEIRVIA